MANHYSKLSELELGKRLAAAEHLKDHPDECTRIKAAQAWQDVTEELASRNEPVKIDKKVEFLWVKRPTSKLYHFGELVGEVKQVSNHSNVEDKVYVAFVFGAPFREFFEYVDAARDEVLEEVQKRLLDRERTKGS
jgi:hypothetical protein